MKTEKETLQLLALSMIEKVGPVTGKNLIAALGSAENVLRARTKELLAVQGVYVNLAKSIRGANTLEQARAEMEYCHRKGIEILTYDSPQYPEVLANIFSSPLIIYKKGNISLNDAPTIAIVGTRQPTPYGTEISRFFSREFAMRKINVVSGLALGIDAEAHRGALEAGGTTTAVLGHTVGHVYPPQHKALHREIAARGALVSEFTSTSKMDPKNFPARNRIISGLSMAVIVVEAGEKGGALITARFAFDQDRLVYAIPGPVNAPFSVGCNRLIRDEVAKLVLSPDEILNDLAPRLARYGSKFPAPELLRKPDQPLTAPERDVLKTLAEGSKHFDQIAADTERSSGQLLFLLLQMEVKGLVRQMPGKWFGLP